jgi:hypothetical protein
MSLLIALVLLCNDGQRTVPIAIPFENVTADADGLWITTRITIDTAEDEIDGRTFYGCLSDDHISRSVCFKGFIDLNENVPHLVIGRLRVIYHGPVNIDGDEFVGFTEYRLEKAFLVR